MRFMSTIVHYTPHDQMIFVSSSRVVDIISHDPRFYEGTSSMQNSSWYSHKLGQAGAYVVEAPDGAGHFYTCGCFDGKLITKTPELRIPLLMTKPTSVLVNSHHIPLELTVDIETTVCATVARVPFPTS